MSLRVRLALATALVVAFSVALASVAIFFSMRADLLQNVDNELKDTASAIQGRPFATEPPTGKPVNVFPAQHFGERDYLQVVSAKGTRIRPTNEGAMPIDSRTLAVAAGTHEAFFTDMSIAGVHARVLTVPVASRFAVQVATPLDSVDRELHRLELILLLVSLAGVVLAAGAGAIVSHTTLVAVRRVSDAAERVTSTLDTSERVPEKGKDELGRLAVSFNSMLAALQEAIDQQKRFVADASHELLTPVTSLQTNLEVLAKAPRLPAAKRRDLIGDVLGELREVRKLIGSLVELARGKNGEERGPVRFDGVISDCIDQATLRYPKLHFVAELEPTTVEGDAARLERAVGNLLENAAKWSEEGGLVEIGLAGGELSVRDRGPGISDEDKPHVFERFYRARAARGLPGSGLGLAIVHEIAEDHGGSVEADDAEGGGALLRLRLPVTPAKPV
ncbi:MAG: HAMP domain-containing sensor histidine kinase [Gaiellaceae bacterium]